MVLIDTSLWINVFSDKQGDYTAGLYQMIAGRDVFLTRFQQLELLQGARDEREWGRLSDYLEGQDYLETSSDTWQGAARIYYTLRKRGLTVRSPVDCCIAQIAIENSVLLMHDDRDFEMIAQHFSLQQQRWSRQSGRQIHESQPVDYTT